MDVLGIGFFTMMWQMDKQKILINLEGFTFNLSVEIF